MSEVLTLRLPEQIADEVRAIARRERRSVSDVGARMLDEWVRQSRFTHVEFRSFNGERHACIKERLQVWQVIMVAKGYDMDVDKTAEHLVLSSEQVLAAFGYYDAYPEEIDAALRDNSRGYERLKEMLPGIIRITLPPDNETLR